MTPDAMQWIVLTSGSTAHSRLLADVPDTDVVARLDLLLSDGSTILLGGAHPSRLDVPLRGNVNPEGPPPG